MPVVDKLAGEYFEQIDFVAPAWKGTLGDTQARAAELFTSGRIMWGLDEEEEIFGLYGVPYQPVTVLIAHDDTVVEAWPGIRSEADIRAAVENLVALAG